MSARLLLHWPLDAVTPESRALDASDLHLNGAVKGDPANLPDRRFGSCLKFDGLDDAVLSPPLPPLRAYTIAAWINPADAVRRGPVTVLATLNGGVRLVLNPDGSPAHRFASAVSPDEGHAGPAGGVPAGTWTHLAVTKDAQFSRIFLNGVQVAQLNYRDLTRLPAALAVQAALRGDPVPQPAPLALSGLNPNFAGLAAHVRVYDDALTELQIKHDMADDEAALESFVRTHPVEFALVNADSQPVLYIDEASGGQPMTLTLTNASRYDLEVVPVTELSPTSFHFALRFRKGTLPQNLPVALATPDWALQAAPDGTALYLLWKAPQPIAPGTSVSVRFTGMNADGAAGTRGTRVELDYRRLRYRGEKDELSGTRLQFMDVVNHRGRRDLPIDLRLVGGDRVLNDPRTASELRIHLTNLLRDGAGIALRASAPASAFTVSFDVQQPKESRPWALTSSGEAGNAKLEATDRGRWAVSAASRGQRVQWTVTPVADTVLKPDEFLELWLREIFAMQPPGHAPIVVEYRNIPGYADGAMTVSVERAPLLFSGTGNAGLGGSNTLPQTRLHILSAPQDPPTGALAIGPAKNPLHIGQAVSYSWLNSPPGNHLALNPQSTGNVSIGTPIPAAKLHVAAPNSAPSGTAAVIIGGTADRASQFQFGHDNDYIWLQSSWAKPLALQPVAGNVGIGTTAANDGKLTISTTGSHLQLRREAGAGGGGKVLYLELFQDTSVGDAVTYPSIRFHHGNKFWHRIEGRPEGFQFKTGYLPSDDLVDIYARGLNGVTAVVSSLRIGGVTIGENELRILQRLAAGQLEFDLYNVKQGEYAYAADYNPFDNDRRYVWTWRPKGRVNQGRWQLHFPG
ncbi:LamG domain-containing protein [Sphaerisporangium album]|uniref:LamG domain-containing protein n=1 Tax=Sphaerisporangium album TaxID=509200 RepID=A0A367FMS6_9ACTN|nr:LamG domain-containing protein [Sphaerisporangium album]RCG31571.1 LamG domain-containing protein [Sphaerisporangium album]